MKRKSVETFKWIDSDEPINNSHEIKASGEVKIYEILADPPIYLIPHLFHDSEVSYLLQEAKKNAYRPVVILSNGVFQVDTS